MSAARMHNTSVSFGTFAQWLWAWLKKAKVFWLMLAVLLAAVAVAFWPDTAEPRVRITGWVLELCGLATVAWGLRQTRREFDRPDFFAIARTWWNERPRLHTRTGTLAGYASVGSLRASGTLSPLKIARSDLTLEERIGELETRVQAMNEHIEKIQIDISQEVSARTEALTQERRVREEKDTDINRKLEAAETGGLHISMIGIVWLAAGLTLSTIPNELLCLWK